MDHMLRGRYIEVLLICQNSPKINIILHPYDHYKNVVIIDQI